MKILHLPTPTGGNAWGLSNGERQLGLESEVLYLQNNWLNYPADKVLFQTSPQNLKQKFDYLINIFKEFLKIRNQYDVFHFNFGTSLIDFPKFGLPPLLDIPYYKGKIFVTYNGCDARQKYPTIERVPFSACHDNQCYDGVCNDKKLDLLKKTKIKKFDSYANGIFAVNPDLLYFLPKRAKFLPYTIANWNQIKTLNYNEPKNKLKIVHAPTNRSAKGSQIILECLNKIKDQYREKIDIILVENMSNSKALQIYAEADIIIDQILIGWYGGFAVEVMKMGKPVMAFIREEDLKFIPKEMALGCKNAIINVNPDTLYENLCNIIENHSILKQYREAALDYVNRWHNPLFVAKITKSAYES